MVLLLRDLSAISQSPPAGCDLMVSLTAQGPSGISLPAGCDFGVPLLRGPSGISQSLPAGCDLSPCSGTRLVSPLMENMLRPKGFFFYPIHPRSVSDEMLLVLVQLEEVVPLWHN